MINLSKRPAVPAEETQKTDEAVRKLVAYNTMDKGAGRLDMGARQMSQRLAQQSSFFHGPYDVVGDVHIHGGDLGLAAAGAHHFVAGVLLAVWFGIIAQMSGRE